MVLSSEASLSLDKILLAKQKTHLKVLVDRQKNTVFLNKLCKYQKLQYKIPTACYKLALNADPQCLYLKLEQLALLDINQALKSSFLSFSCRKHLLSQKKILIYRKKDVLLSKLKKHWTDSKVFF